jgi:signal transduction histidine kinase
MMRSHYKSMAAAAFLQGRSKIMSSDELSAKLARLDDLERRFDATLQRAKLEAMKELAYGAGHEINNPLANIASRAQTLLQGETDPDKRRKLAAINAQAFRAHEMIADLMLFARPPQLRPQNIDLNELVRSIAKQWQPDAETANVEIIVSSTSAPLTVTADPIQLRVALGALVRNSLEAIDGGGQIEIGVHAIGGNGNGFAPAAYAVEITVADNGPGISAEIRDKIFDPFFSGREAGRGLGFGLSKCWRIVTLHGGEIEVRESPRRGATFVVRLLAHPPM